MSRSIDVLIDKNAPTKKASALRRMQGYYASNTDNTASATLAAIMATFISWLTMATFPWMVIPSIILTLGTLASFAIGISSAKHEVIHLSEYLSTATATELPIAELEADLPHSGLTLDAQASIRKDVASLLHAAANQVSALSLYEGAHSDEDNLHLAQTKESLTQVVEVCAKVHALRSHQDSVALEQKQVAQATLAQSNSQKASLQLQVASSKIESTLDLLSGTISAHEKLSPTASELTLPVGTDE